MRYLTPQLYAALQDFSGDAAMNAADAAWEAAGNEYDLHLQAIGSVIAPVLEQFGKVLLHDALVQSMSRTDQQFTLVLQADIPPQDVVTICYDLSGEPVVEYHVVPPACRADVLQYECDEFDVVEENGQRQFVHSILFGNGCELRLRFRDVRLTLARPVLPLQGAVVGSSPVMSAL